MDSEALADFVDAAAAAGGIDGVMVVRNGYGVADATVYPFPHDGLHDVLSVTKSVMSTLIGIAVDRGLLAVVHRCLFARVHAERLCFDPLRSDALRVRAGVDDGVDFVLLRPEELLTTGRP